MDPLPVLSAMAQYQRTPSHKNQKPLVCSLSLHFRSQYRKDAHLAYQRRMLAAHVGHSDYPKIRTFNKSDSSTNSVFKDLEAAEKL